MLVILLKNRMKTLVFHEKSVLLQINRKMAGRKKEAMNSEFLCLLYNVT